MLLLIPAGASAKRMAGVDVRAGCDFTEPAVCQFPWPNDHFTKRDKRTDTGLRLRLAKSADAAQQERQADRPGRHEPRRRVQPRQRDAHEGSRARHAGGRRSAASCRRSRTCSAASRRARRWCVINARTGKRHPIWAEIDSNPSERADRVLIIRPARNFEEGERYIVALRNLRNARGKDDQGGTRLPHLPRPHPDRGAADREAPRALRADLQRSCKQGGRQARRACTWRGTSPWRASAASRAACSTSATTRSGRSATRT